MKSYIKAFTLAEVLITLAIIGVVAAMTIPTLISNYQRTSFETGFAKTYSTIQNGFKMSMTDDFCTESKCFKLIDYIQEEYGAPNTPNMDNFFKSNFKVSKICKGSDITECTGGKWIQVDGEPADMTADANAYSVMFADGSSFSILGNLYCAILVMVDSNGPKGPNRFGYDSFMFMIDGCRNEKWIILPWGSKSAGPDWIGAWDKDKNQCGEPGKKVVIGGGAQGYGCGARLIDEGFKIKHF